MIWLEQLFKIGLIKQTHIKGKIKKSKLCLNEWGCESDNFTGALAGRLC